MLGAQPMLGCSEVLVQVSHLLCDFEDMLLEGTDLLEGFQAHRHLAPESCALAVACLVSLKSFHAGNETAREGECSVIKTTLANPRRQIESTISTSQPLAGRKSLAKQLHHRVVGNGEEQLLQGEKLASVFLSDLDEPLRHRVRRAHLMVVIEAVIENHAPHDHLLICAYTRLRDPHVVYTALRRGFGSLAQFAKPGWDIFWGYRYHLQLAHNAICVEAYGKARVMAVARHVVELVGIRRTADDTGEVARRKMTSRSDNTGGQPHGQFRLISWKSEFFMHQHPLHAGAQDEKYGDAFGDGNRTNSLERGTDLVTQILQLVAVSRPAHRQLCQRGWQSPQTRQPDFRSGGQSRRQFSHPRDRPYRPAGGCLPGDRRADRRGAAGDEPALVHAAHLQFARALGTHSNSRRAIWSSCCRLSPARRASFSSNIPPAAAT